MGMFGKCKGPGWGAHGSLFWLLRNQTLQRCRCGLCPLVSRQCGPGVSWGRGPASWIEPPHSPSRRLGVDFGRCQPLPGCLPCPHPG